MPENTQARPIAYCSFCGKSQHQVERLIAGPHAVYICNECVTLCWEIINEKPKGKRTENDPSRKVTK